MTSQVPELTGGHVVHDYRPDSDADANLMRDFFELASPGQLSNNGVTGRRIVSVHGVIPEQD